MAVTDGSRRVGQARPRKCYAGLTTRRCASGEIDWTGRFSKCGDKMLRSYLYEAAHVLLTRERPNPRRPAGANVPAGTLALVRSPLALRSSKEQSALHTLIRQRHLTPSCGGHAPTAERTMDPARIFSESLTPRPELENRQGHSLQIIAHRKSLDVPRKRRKVRALASVAKGHGGGRREPLRRPVSPSGNSYH
jgi:hypothetical protein